MVPYVTVETNYDTLSQYDWVIVPMWGGYYKWILDVKAKRPDIKLIGVTDIEMQAIQYAPRRELISLVKVARAVDILLCSNPDFMPALLKIRPDVHNLYGWCLFPQKHELRRIEPLLKDKTLVSIGCSNCGYNRNIFENFIVFKELLKTHPNLTGYYWNILPEHSSDILEFADNIGIRDNLRLMPEAAGWDSFLTQFSNMYISIHLYTFKVVSRLAQDAMGLGIPHVGCYSNYADRKFCDASVQEWDIDGAVKNAIRLLDDTEYYEQIRQKQFTGIETYSEKAIGERIMNAIKSYKAS